MKKFVTVSIVIFLMILSSMLIVGCSQNEENSVDETNVEQGLLLSENSISLEIYEDGVLSVMNSTEEVVWSSLNNEIVEINSEGYFLAKKEGTTYIKAVSGERNGQCKVVVNNSCLRPNIKLNVDAEISLINQDSLTFKPYISYNGKDYYDATFTYSNENDIVSIANEKITALKVGETEINITATWHGYTGLLTVTLPIKVVKNNYIAINQRIVDLETSNYYGAKSFTTLTAKVFDDGVGVDKNITWDFLEENNCVEFENGNLTSKKAGKTVLQAKATLDDGSIVYSPQILISVKTTVKEFNELQDIDYDEAKLNYDFPSTFEIQKVLDGTNEIEIDYSTDIFVPYKLGYRDIELLAKDDNGKEIIFKYKTKIVKKIKTALELVSISTSYGNNPTSENNYMYEGYFELANNIDATGYKMANEVNADYNNAQPVGGFMGVFDGKGYTIDNLSAYLENGFTFGIFGQIGQGSIVKNVAFTNLHGTFNNNINYECASLAYYSFGQVENVLIQTDDEFLSSVRFGGNGASFKNFVVLGLNYYSQFIDIYECLVGSAVCYSDLVNQVVVIDSDSVVTLSSEEYPNREWKSYNRNSYKTEINNYNPTEFFDDSIWVVENGKIPYFKSMYSTSIDIFIGEAVNLIELDKNGTFELLNSYQNVEIKNSVLNIGKSFDGDEIKVKVTNSLFDVNYIITFNVKGIYLEDVIYDLNGSNDIEILLEGVGNIEELYLNNILLSETQYNFASGKLTITRSEIDSLDFSYGDYIIKIITDGEVYKGKFIVVTKVIYTAEELINLQEKYGNNASESNHYQYDGYFILANNINATGYTWNSFVKVDDEDPAECGFKGIFDGRGYVITNLQALATNGISYGVFGALATGAIVRNVAFIDVHGNPSNNVNHNSAVLAYFNNGSIENVYVEVKDTFVSTFNRQGNANYKNFVVVGESLYSVELTINEVDYSISNGIAQGDLVGKKPIIDFNSVITVTRDTYYTLEENKQWQAFNAETYKTEIQGYNFEAYFDSNIWNVNNGEIPTFKNHVKVDRGIEWDENWN